MFLNETRAALHRAATILAKAGIENSTQEARWIASHVVAERALLAGAPLDAPAFDALVARRAAHEPLAYILGDAPFCGLTLAVSPATLIPRLDTETLIDAAVTECDAGAVRRVLDLGTGTGCLLLAALQAFPGAYGVGADRVAEACVLARGNAARNGLAGRAGFLQGDWGAAIGGTFDLVLANPPYIAGAEIAALMPEVSLHEPRTALDGGPDGLDCYRTLISQLPDLLAPGGVAIYELGANQAADVARLAAGWRHRLFKDTAGHLRAISLRKMAAGGAGGKK